MKIYYAPITSHEIIEREAACPLHMLMVFWITWGKTKIENGTAEEATNRSVRLSQCSRLLGRMIGEDSLADGGMIHLLRAFRQHSTAALEIRVRYSEVSRQAALNIVNA